MAMTKILVRRAGLALAAGLMMLGSAGAQAADAVTIGTVGASSVNNWPSYIAQSKGYFEAAGIRRMSFFLRPAAGSEAN